MPELWQLKDYTAAMSRSIELLLSILEKDWFYEKSGPKVLYFIFQEVLKSLGSMMGGFCQTWQHLLMKNKILVLKTHDKYGNRSNVRTLKIGFLWWWSFLGVLVSAGFSFAG
jgi:hypothetical protein